MAQLDLNLPQWGGRRRGAGRKRKDLLRRVPHRKRRRFRWKPLHVTIRMRREVWSLRTRRCFRVMKYAFAKGCERFGYRLVHFSVQRNHIHLIVEAPDEVELGRAMKGSGCASPAPWTTDRFASRLPFAVVIHLAPQKRSPKSRTAS